jgi:hypothetical protein
MPQYPPVLSGLLGRAAEELEEAPVEDVLNQRRFPRTGDASNTDQATQRNPDIDTLEVVGGCTDNLDEWMILRRNGPPPL